MTAQSVPSSLSQTPVIPPPAISSAVAATEMTPSSSRVRARPPEIVNPQAQALDFSRYQNPYGNRVRSEEISYVFSLQYKYETWRRILLYLAMDQKALGLNITQEQLDEMIGHMKDIDFTVENKREERPEDVVMAQIKAFSAQCPLAKPIIYLGATSCLVTDNADVIIMRSALNWISLKLSIVDGVLANAAMKYKDLPCLAYTHLQPAQLTTVGKRIADWLQGFIMAHEKLINHIDDLSAPGIQGETSTQARFLELFQGDYKKVEELNKQFASSLGFKKTVPLSNQTYLRQVDTETLYCLSRIAQAARKAAMDLQFLTIFGEIEVDQTLVPSKTHRQICSLAIDVMAQVRNAEEIASTQGFEATLDNSASRSSYMAQAFLATNSILWTLDSVVGNMSINEKKITERVKEQIPSDSKKLIGRIPELTEKYIKEIVYPLLEKYPGSSVPW